MSQCREANDVETADATESPVYAAFCAATRSNSNGDTTTKTFAFTLKASSYYEAKGMADAIARRCFPDGDGWRCREPMVVATDVGLEPDEVVAKIEEKMEAADAPDDVDDDDESAEDAQATTDRIARIDASCAELRSLYRVGGVMILGFTIGFFGQATKSLPMIMAAFLITFGGLISLRWVGRPK